jgi:hypothetical protein
MSDVCYIEVDSYNIFICFVVITPTFHCGDTYECKNAQVDNLNSFAGHLMVGLTTY